MKTKLLPVLLLAVCLLLGSLGAQAAEAEYEDGTYTVSFAMEGLGRHNVAWDTAALTVEGGRLYIDFTLERVDPRDRAPQYDYLTTPCGTYYPELDDASFTCTFRHVHALRGGLCAGDRRRGRAPEGAGAHGGTHGGAHGGTHTGAYRRTYRRAHTRTDCGAHR